MPPRSMTEPADAAQGQRPPEQPAPTVIRPRPNYDKLVLLQILFTVMGGVFGAPFVLSAIIDGPSRLLAFAFSDLGSFAFVVGFVSVSLGFFLLVALLSVGSVLVTEPFQIDATTGTTTDACGRQWVRERHGPAKVILSKAGPASIIFPAFDFGAPEKPGARPLRSAGGVRRFLQRGFARFFLGARGTELDGLVLPVQFLTDRDAIMAAVKPVPPPLRWF